MEPSLDVLILGDSRVFTGVDPYRFERCLSENGLHELHVYSLSEFGMVPSCYPLVLRNLWNRGIRPSAVIAGLSVWGLNGRISYHDTFAEQYISLRYLPAVIGATRDFDLSCRLICTVLFPCYRHHRTLREYFVRLFSRSTSMPLLFFEAVRGGPAPPMMVLDNHGQLRALFTRVEDGTRGNAPRLPERYELLEEFELGEYPVWAIEELARMCMQSGTQLVFFQTPVASDHLRYYQDNQVEQFQQVVTRVSREYGIPFMDLSRSLSDDCFRDSNHLNDRGIARISDILCEQAIEQLRATPGLE